MTSEHAGRLCCNDAQTRCVTAVQITTIKHTVNTHSIREAAHDFMVIHICPVICRWPSSCYVNSVYLPGRLSLLGFSVLSSSAAQNVGYNFGKDRHTVACCSKVCSQPVCVLHWLCWKITDVKKRNTHLLVCFVWWCLWKAQIPVLLRVCVAVLTCWAYQLCLCLAAELISCPVSVKPECNVTLIKDLKVFACTGCTCESHTVL